MWHSKQVGCHADSQEDSPPSGQKKQPCEKLTMKFTAIFHGQVKKDFPLTIEGVTAAHIEGAVAGIVNNERLNVDTLYWLVYGA